MSLSLSHLADNICPPFARPVLDRVKDSPIARRLASGALWVSVGSGIGKILALLSTILVARILEVRHYGEFEAVRSTANMFIVFASFGMGATSTKYISEFLVTGKERVGRIIGLNYLFTLLMGALFTLLFYLAAPLLCEHLLKSPQLVDEMRFGAVLLFLVTFMGAQSGVVSGFQDFRGLAWTEITTGILRVPLLIAGAYYGGVFGALLAFAVSISVNVLLNSRVIFLNVKRHKIRYAFREAYRELPVLWKFSLPSTLAGIISIPAIWLCGMMLVRQPDGLSQYGIYIAAQQVCALLMFLPTVMVQVAVPMLSEADAMKDKTRFRKIVLTNLAINVGTTMIIALPLAIFSTQIMGLFGADFASGAGILLVYCLASLLMGPDWIVSQILTSRGKMWSLLCLNIAWGIVLLATTSILLANGFGGHALVWGLVAAYAVRILITCLFNRRGAESAERGGEKSVESRK